MLTLLGSLVALAVPSTPGPPQVVIWPDGQEAVPVDSVVYLRETRSDLPDPTFTRDDGAPVPFTSVLLEGTDALWWRMIVAEEALAPGGYTVGTQGTLATFTVEDRLADTVDPPSPYRRWTSSDCEDEGTLSYRVCGGGILHLVEVGDTGPSGPGLDLASVVVIGTGEDTLRLFGNLGVEAGWSGRVWISSLDEAGRFTGWWAGDPVELPAPGVYVTEAPSGTTATPGGTITSIGECPAFSGWERIEEADCAAAEVVTTTEPGCGCRTPGPLAGGWVFGLLLFSRRSSRSSRSSALRSR